VEENTEVGPWDQKLAERLARDAWVAANRPLENRREPSFLQRVRSRAFWLGLLPLVCVGVLLFVTRPDGLFAVVLWAAYFGAIPLVRVIERRMRRASSQD
jgi:hypothetical protein